MPAYFRQTRHTPRVFRDCIFLKMSQRLAERVPKRMLVFFNDNEDQSTSVLNTNLVTQVLEEGGKICEGASVEVNYGGVMYQAVILKLHGM